MPDSPKRPEPREPTHDERMKIRELLDGCFDDELGAYASGYSDERVALEAGDVPWAIVARIRDAGWGPIRQTHETVEMRQEIEALKKEYAGNRDLASIMTKDINEGLDKLNSLEARLAALASSAGRNGTHR